MVVREETPVFAAIVELFFSEFIEVGAGIGFVSSEFIGSGPAAVSTVAAVAGADLEAEAVSESVRERRWRSATTVAAVAGADLEAEAVSESELARHIFRADHRRHLVAAIQGAETQTGAEGQARAMFAI